MSISGLAVSLLCYSPPRILSLSIPFHLTYHHLISYHLHSSPYRLIQFPIASFLYRFTHILFLLHSHSPLHSLQAPTRLRHTRCDEPAVSHPCPQSQNLGTGSRRAHALTLSPRSPAGCHLPQFARVRHRAKSHNPPHQAVNHHLNASRLAPQATLKKSHPLEI